MINFATLQGLTIPEGVVTQIADASGRVLWSAMLDYPEGSLVFKVKKISTSTYAGETTYPNDKFILFDIYPKTNGTVKVTYGGLTKTVTDTSGATEPNAQQVFFGTFNGVSDSTATPDTGTLIVEGDYHCVTCGTYLADSKGTATYCGCVTEIVDFGNMTVIPAGAFKSCQSLRSVVIPPCNIIGGDGMFDEHGAFAGCTNLTNVIITESSGIGRFTFADCSSLTHISLPSSLSKIYQHAFKGCYSLTSVIFDSPSKWVINESDISLTIIDTVDTSNPENNATLLKQTYEANYWTKRH